MEKESKGSAGIKMRENVGETYLNTVIFIYPVKCLIFAFKFTVAKCNLIMVYLVFFNDAEITLMKVAMLKA